MTDLKLAAQKALEAMTALRESALDTIATASGWEASLDTCADEAEAAIIALRSALQHQEEREPVQVSEYIIDGDPRRLGSDDIRIARAKQMEGPAKWAVRRMGECLNKQGEWEYEPMPSSRDDDFLARCRFDSPAEAIAAAIATRQGEKPSA